MGLAHIAALFSESTDRVLVSVCCENDVQFVRLCEARGIPVLRIGVNDGSGSAGADSDARLEIQGIASWSLGDLAGAH